MVNSEEPWDIFHQVFHTCARLAVAALVLGPHRSEHSRVVGRVIGFDRHDRRFRVIAHGASVRRADHGRESIVCSVATEGERVPFNPLDRVNLARSVEHALLAEPLSALPPTGPFPGAGLYALYYLGSFPAYAPIVPPARAPGELPIYVGRAIPRGARAGAEGLLPTTTEPVLYKRLCEHVSSLRAVENLRVEDFRCRYLVVDDIWVPLAEALMIQHYQPVWNGAVQGFGNHDPGKGRREGARPDWDEVHPGRLWAAKQSPARRSAMESLTRIALHFASCSTLTDDQRASG